MKNEIVPSVKNFVKALDESNFDEARRYLSPQCSYFMNQTEICGPEAIIRSYAENAKWAAEKLERVAYESEITPISVKTFDVLYTDRIFHRGLEHAFRSHQLLVLNDRGEIEQISNEDINGEQEALKEFFMRCGIHRS